MVCILGNRFSQPSNEQAKISSFLLLSLLVAVIGDICSKYLTVSITIYIERALPRKYIQFELFNILVPAPYKSLGTKVGCYFSAHVSQVKCHVVR